MRLLLHFVVLLATSALASAATSTQTSPLELRAAFVFNFAKFTEWPTSVVAEDAPITLCVIDDERAFDVFRRVAKGRSVGSHGLAVRMLRLEDDLRGCQVVYAPVLDASRAADLLASIGDAPILTISDYEQFARTGGVANFIVEDGMVRFAINADSAQRARLRINSRLMALAKLVRSGNGHK
jgi:hypothetical protein